jgi:hypothetical protein
VVSSFLAAISHHKHKHKHQASVVWVSIYHPTTQRFELHTNRYLFVSRFPASFASFLFAFASLLNGGFRHINYTWAGCLSLSLPLTLATAQLAFLLLISKSLTRHAIREQNKQTKWNQQPQQQRNPCAAQGGIEIGRCNGGHKSQRVFSDWWTKIEQNVEQFVILSKKLIYDAGQVQVVVSTEHQPSTETKLKQIIIQNQVKPKNKETIIFFRSHDLLLFSISPAKIQWCGQMLEELQNFQIKMALPGILHLMSFCAGVACENIWWSETKPREDFSSLAMVSNTHCDTTTTEHGLTEFRDRSFNWFVRHQQRASQRNLCPF